MRAAGNRRRSRSRSPTTARTWIIDFAKRGAMMSEMKLVKNNQQQDEEYAELDSLDYKAVKYQDAVNTGILFVCKGTRDEKFIARHEIGVVDVRQRGRSLWLICHSLAVHLRAGEGKTLRELARAFWDR